MTRNDLVLLSEYGLALPSCALLPSSGAPYFEVCEASSEANKEGYFPLNYSLENRDPNAIIRIYKTKNVNTNSWGEDYAENNYKHQLDLSETIATMTEIWDTGGRVTTTTLSDEFTTDELKSLVNDRISFPGYWVESSSAVSQFFLPPNETVFRIIKTKFRVAHWPTATCYLKCWIRRRWRPSPAEGEEVDFANDVYTDAGTYEWRGSGSPCINDPLKPAWDEKNKIRGSRIFTPEPPTENGSYTYYVGKYSYVEGYTPDNPETSPRINPDGFPSAHPIP